jgi:acyl-coenzyme A synthetase/AMP-(fatty) acid ligase
VTKDQRLIGFVVPRGEPQKAAFAQYCRANIPQEKFPDRVFFVKSLPKNANGKIDRPRLKAIAERGPPQQKAPDNAAQMEGKAF